VTEKWVTIKSSGEQKAREEAKDKFQKTLGTKIDSQDLVVRPGKTPMIERMKGLKVFHVGIKEVLPSDAEVNLNGSFKVSFLEEGVFLNIFPPRGEGKPVSLNDIKREAEKLKIQDIDWNLVEENLQGLIQENKKGKVFLAGRKPELDKDAEVEVKISKDGLEAHVDYFPPLGGKHITREGLENKLKEAGIVFGLKEDKLESIPGSRIPLNGVLIARGTEPIPGEDGSLDYHFKSEDEGRKGSLREDGSIDHFNLDLIKNVRKGEPLVSVKPPVPGKPGIKVTGEEIPPKDVREAKLPLGKNVEPDEEGKTLLAGIDGQVIKEKGRVSVFPVHQVRGNVDLSTGHINFLGTVIVDGNVTEGFKVEATGDVEVNGNVSAGTIISGGNVKIRKGFLGKKKGKIQCEENLEVKFIENGEVRAGGDVLVGDAILHSNISASGKIVVKGKGLIAGGKIQAGQEVEVNTLGSSLATKTEVSVGVPPEIREELDKKLKNLGDLSDNLSKVEKAIRLLEKQKEKGLLGEERLEQLKKLAETWGDLKRQEENLEKETQEIQEKIYSSEDGQIKVHKTLYPGVSIQIAGANHRVKDKRSRTRLVCSKKEIAYTTL